MTYWKKRIINSTRTHTQAIRAEIFREELLLLNITILNSKTNLRFQFKNKWLPYLMGLYFQKRHKWEINNLNLWQPSYSMNVRAPHLHTERWKDQIQADRQPRLVFLLHMWDKRREPRSSRHLWHQLSLNFSTVMVVPNCLGDHNKELKPLHIGFWTWLAARHHQS
jgi:hypothetical protein